MYEVFCHLALFCMPKFNVIEGALSACSCTLQSHTGGGKMHKWRECNQILRYRKETLLILVRGRTGPIAFDGELTRARFAKRLFAMSRPAVIRKFKENK